MHKVEFSFEFQVKSMEETDLLDCKEDCLKYVLAAIEIIKCNNHAQIFLSKQK